jgi:hypothetical protein
MQLVGIVPQRHAIVDVQLRDVDRLVDVHHVLSLRVHLHEHLLAAHDVDDLADVRARLLQQGELLAKQAHL